MSEIEVKMKLEADPELCARMFCEMNSDHQAEFFAQVSRQMEEWSAYARDTQIYYISQAIKMQAKAKEWIEQLDLKEDEVVDIADRHREQIPGAQCGDCKGTGEYRGFTSVEKCSGCGGTGVKFDQT
jgi:DnaJ-class molecular chaperone